MVEVVTETTAEKAPKTPMTEEQALRKQVGRTIGRGVWMAGYTAEHPDADKVAVAAAWAEARKDFTKIGLRALKALEKTGFQVVRKTDA